MRRPEEELLKGGLEGELLVLGAGVAGELLIGGGLETLDGDEVGIGGSSSSAIGPAE